MQMYSTTLILSLIGSVIASLPPPDLSTGNNVNECLNSIASLEILTKDSSDYQSAIRTFNERTVPQPSYVIYPQTLGDVQHAVKCGQIYNNKITSLSGGHGYAGFATEGDITISMSKFKNLDADSDFIVKAGTGNRLGELIRGIYDENWVLPTGTCPSVGIAGHAMGGGYGPLSRKYGLLLDTIQSAEIVLANGTAVNATSTENQDLLFAIKGAGPSFGVVTQLSFKAQPQPSNTITFNYSLNGRTLEESVQAFIAYQDFVAQNPSYDLYPTLVFGSDGNNGITFEFSGNYFGSEDDYNNLIKPLMDGFKIRDGDDTNIQQDQDFIQGVERTSGSLSELNVESENFYSKSLIINEKLQQDQIYSYFGYLFYDLQNAQNEGYGWYIIVDPYNGKINEVDESATAFNHRDALLTFQFFGYVGESQQTLFDYVDGMVNSITDHPTDAYVNYVDPRLNDWQHLYYGNNYERLQQIKSQVDPSNVFKFDQSIELL